MSAQQATIQQQGGKGNLRPHSTPMYAEKPEACSQPKDFRKK